VFFFVVGMEIRREIHQGELSDLRRAALPVAAALGGMLAPALLYLSVAGDGPTRAGWGVPMATDIAFALGVLALLGARVPPALRVLLLALAVIDDLGAIVVIALFYSAGIQAAGLGVAALGCAGIVLLQRLGVRTKAVYVLPALVVWGGVYAAGIHPTIAGVLVGLLTPVRAWLGPEGFLRRVQPQLAPLDASSSALSGAPLHSLLHRLNAARREALSPAESLIEALHPWVAFFIMPVFALANAGVTLEGAALDASAWRALVGVALGLVLGKPIGVLLASWLAVRVRIARLPAGIGLPQLLVLGMAAGIGFTMALFVAQLAFEAPALLSAAKLGILGASLVAGLSALGAGRVLLSTARDPGEAECADAAERSTER
jgi:NhaA family Na+:H+ antiporter